MSEPRKAERSGGLAWWSATREAVMFGRVVCNQGD